MEMLKEKRKFWRKFCSINDSITNHKIVEKIQEFIKENPNLKDISFYTKNFVFGSDEVFLKFKDKLKGLI